MKKKIVIAGATGFIGRWIIKEFEKDFKIIALSRKKILHQENKNVEWRKVDLYSISSSENALKGADIGIYLVHSMQPSTRLSQGKFEDTDLLLADNFSLAAQKNNLKQIIYLGGILPKDKNEISKHLSSRYEVEKTLGSRNTPLTAIRAGIIIGPGGSSFKIITSLIKNLPIMACPKWTKSKNQPIDVFDVLNIIKKSISNKLTFNKKIEIGGPEIMTYMDLLIKTSKLMKKNRLIFSIPLFTVGLSKLWVGLFTGSSMNFISPLVESLKHKMIPDNKYSELFKIKFSSIEESIKKALSKDFPDPPNFKKPKKEKNTVRSIQRIYNPKKYDTKVVAKYYPIWLSKIFAGIINSNFDGQFLRFYVLNTILLELKLIDDRSSKNRQLYYITGGILTKRKDLGWLEFRSILDNEFIITAIHEYVPKLPWFLYKLTQAKIHLYVMNKFEKEISKKRLKNSQNPSLKK